MYRIVIELKSPVDLNEDIDRTFTHAIEDFASEIAYEDGFIGEEDYFVIKRIVATEDI